MNLAYNYQLIPDLRKVKDMERFIAGSYWENDVWNLNDPFWDDYSIGKKSFTSRRITFFEYPHLFRLEMKYYLATRLLRKTLNPSSLWSDYQFMLKKFVCFLQEAYPQINSFSEISIDEMVPAWLNYVALSGRKSSRQGYRAQIYQLYLFFSDFYDTRDEYEKDIWDCRKIPSVDIPVQFHIYTRSISTTGKKIYKNEIGNLRLINSTFGIRGNYIFSTVYCRSGAYVDKPETSYSSLY